MNPRNIESPLLAARAEATESLQSTQHPRDCGAPRGQLTVILPRSHPASPRRPPGLLPRHGQGPSLGAPGRPVHHQRGMSRVRAQASPPRAARRGGGGGPGRARASASRREQGAYPRPPYASWGASRLGTGRGMGGRLFSRPGSGGRDLDEGAVWRPGRPLEAHDLFAVQRLEYPGEHVGVRPAVQPGVDGVPGVQSGRSPAPFAALRGDRQDSGEPGAGGQADRAARHREGRAIRAE